MAAAGVLCVTALDTSSLAMPAISEFAMLFKLSFGQFFRG